MLIIFFSDRDLREYHIQHRYRVPAVRRYPTPSFPTQPARASTPMPDDPVLEIPGPSVSTSEPVTEAPAVPAVPADEPVTEAPTAQSVSLAGENQQTGLPTNDVLVSYISYGDQGTF